MSGEEAAGYWNNPSLKMIGGGDLLMLECKGAV
jgi:hypothetical protein